MKSSVSEERGAWSASTHPGSMGMFSGRFVCLPEFHRKLGGVEEHFMTAANTAAFPRGNIKCAKGGEGGKRAWSDTPLPRKVVKHNFLIG